MKKFLVPFLALLSGLVGVLAFSPFDYWWSAYLSMFGLIAIVKIFPKRTALWGAFWWGLGFFTFGLNWLNVSIHEFGGAPLIVSYALVVLLAAYLSLFPVLFAWLVRKLNLQTPTLYPVLWTFTEWLRGWLFTGFPWLQFGYTQIDSPFSGIAPIFGVQGETFFVVIISAVLFQIFSVWQTNKSKSVSKIFPRLLSAVALVAILGYAAFYAGKIQFVKSDDSRALNVTLVQGNIAQNLKWDPAYLMQTLEIYQRLIGQHIGKTDLIILPEAALPALENQLQPFFQSLQRVAEQNNTAVMVGSIYLDENRDRLFNSIVVAGESSAPYDLLNSQRYSKSHLVPFGEYVPLESILRPLGTVFNLPMSNFEAGELVQTPLFAKGFNFLPAICYEIIFGDQLQQNWQPETDFLLTISNDAWFGTSIGPWQHLQMARMRALELGKPLIRATNTGITVFVDAKGKIVSQALQFIETTLSHQVSPTVGKTPYAVFGNKPLYWLSVYFLGVHLLMGWLRRKLVGKYQNAQP